MKKFSMFMAAAMVILLAGCGRDVPKEAKPAVDLALREFGVPAKCLAIKDVKKAENEKDSFTAVAVCEIDGKTQSGGITVKYQKGKPAVEIVGFGYPALMVVKNGILKFDNSRTVGEALTANLDDLKWEVFVNRRNQIVVKAAGVWKSGGLSFSESTNGVGYHEIPFTVVKPGNQVEAYFIINRNGSFSFGYGKIISSTKDLGVNRRKMFGDDKFSEGDRDVVTSDELEKRRLKGGFLSVLYN